LLITEDPIKYSKLEEYSVIICDYLHWSQKNEYLQLIKDFLNSKIDGKEFDEKFSKIVTVIEEKCRLLLQNYEELKRIEPSPRSLEFGEWISEIYLCCDEFYDYYDLNEGEDPALKTEEQLRDAVTALFPEIQKYF
jgi:hypothetical protein